LHLFCVQVSLLSLCKCSFESLKCHTHVARLEWLYNGQIILVHLDSLKENPSWYVCVYEMNPKENITVAIYWSSQALQVLWRHLFIQWDRGNDLCTAHILCTYFFLMSACSPLSSPFIRTALSYVWPQMLFNCRLQSPRTCFTFFE
jgi:hypothetical protein